MGITFVVSGKGDTIELDVSSVDEIEVRVRALEESYAKSDVNQCTIRVKCLLNRGGVQSGGVLQGLSDWAKACSEGKESCRRVEVIQTYGEVFGRKLTFPEAQLLFFKEVFLTDNSKYLEVQLMIRQKRSKQEDIIIELFE